MFGYHVDRDRVVDSYEALISLPSNVRVFTLKVDQCNLLWVFH